jgi:U3 small nucleolar RNA-associated protein 21
MDLWFYKFQNVIEHVNIKQFLILRNFIRVSQAMFSSSSNIDSYASGKEVVSVKLPSISSTGDAQVEHSGELMNASQPKDAPAFPTQDKQIPDLVTLSLLPKSQWQSLINLDIIKVFYYSVPSHILL